MSKICSCFGHRKIEITEALKKQISMLLEHLIVNDKVNIFYFGGYGEFDKLCYETAKKLKIKYKNIKLIYVRPYYADLPKHIIELYKKDFDECIYLEPKNSFGKTSIIYRNFAMVDRSDSIIFYIKRVSASGAGKVYKYAKHKNKQIFILKDLG